MSRLSSVFPCRTGALLLALGALPFAAPLQAGNVAFPANDNSYSPQMTPDGRYIAFTSLAANLVPNDTNGVEDVFVYDRNTGAIQRVSVNVQGSQGNGQSWGASISANGCYVAFASDATNLVPGDTNGATDIFRKFLPTCVGASAGSVDRMSVSTDEAQGGFVLRAFSGSAHYASISSDGRFVGFYACLSGLVAGSGDCNLYVRDGTRGETLAVRVPVAASGQPGSTLAIGTRTPTANVTELSVAFSTGLAIATADTNGLTDVYLGRNLINESFGPGTWNYTLVSAGTGGAGGNADSSAPSENSYGVDISADGLRIAYISAASNLVAGDTNNQRDVFLYQVQSNTTTRETNGIGTGIGLSDAVGISANGLHVAYLDGNTEEWKVVTVPGGTPDVVGTGRSEGSRLELRGRAAVSDGGTLVAWSTAAWRNTAVPADVLEAVVLTQTRGIGAGTSLVSTGRIGSAADGHSRAASISADGRTVAFSTRASGFGLPDPGSNRDLYLRNLADGALTRVSSAFTFARADSRRPDLSGDGRRVAFLADGGPSTLCGGEQWGAMVVKNDTTLPGFTCLDRDTPALPGLFAGFSFQPPSISDDGVWAAFAGYDTASTFSNRQLYLRNLDSGDVLRATPAPGGGPLTGLTLGQEMMTYELSGDGRYLAYSASDAASPAAIANCEIYGTVRLFDRQTGATSIISRIGGGTAGAPAPAGWASISADGNWVAMISCANLANESSAPAGQKAYLWRRADGSIRRVPPDASSRSAGSSKARTRLSADGRHLAYLADPRCVYRCTSRDRDVVLYDQQTRRIATVSVTPAGGRSNGPSGTPDEQGFTSAPYTLDLSGDGTKVVVASAATNFVPGDDNAADDIFVIDVPSLAVSRVSGFDAGMAADNDRVSPTIAGDGSRMAYGIKDRNGAVAASRGEAARLGKAIGDKWGDIGINSPDGNGEVIITVAPNGAAANGDSGEADISGNGIFVSFSSDASNLSPFNDANSATDVLIYDALMEANTVVSMGPGNQPANGPSGQPSVAVGIGNKWAVGFASDANNLQGMNPVSDNNGGSDVLLAFQDLGITLISRGTGVNGPIGNAPSFEPDVLEGGALVTFGSLASNIKPGGDFNGMFDIYLRDVNASSTLRVSEGMGGDEPDGPSARPSIGRDATMAANSWMVAFESDATNLVAGDFNASTDVFLRIFDGATFSTRLISRAAGSNFPADGPSSAARLAPGGRYVVFASSATNIIFNDTNGVPDLFLYRIADGQVTRVSEGVNPGDDASLSGDVTFDVNGDPVLVFDSAASNLGTEPDNEQAFDVYYRDANGNLVPLDPDQIFASGFEEIQILP